MCTFMHAYYVISLGGGWKLLLALSCQTIRHGFDDWGVVMATR
jgi:hypothetical protein